MVRTGVGVEAGRVGALDGAAEVRTGTGAVVGAAVAVALAVTVGVGCGAATRPVLPLQADSTRTSNGARVEPQRWERCGTAPDWHGHVPTYRGVVRLVPALVVAVLLSGCTASAAKPKAAPSPKISGVQVFTGLLHSHLGKGQYPQSYPQSPPVGGPHSKAWLACQVFDVELPKEAAVHSMEHGAVWLTYQPDLPADQVATLATLAQANKDFVLVSPYTGQDSPVVASAWGLQLKAAKADDPALLDFVRTYAGGFQGGEKAGCASTGYSLDVVQKYIASQS